MSIAARSAGLARALPRLPVRVRLFLLVLAVMLPIGVAALVTIYGLYQEERRAFEQQVMGMTRAMSLVIDRELARRESLLRTLSHSPTLTRNDLEAFYLYAKQVAPTNEVAIVLSDLEGQQILNTRRPYGTTSLPTTVFKGLRTDPLATVVSDLYFAPFGKAFSFAVEVPVVRDGQVRYYLSLGGYASHLQKVLQSQGLPPTWIGSVIDRRGQIVARTINPEQLVGRFVPDDMRAQLKTRREGGFWTVSVDGRSVFASFSVTQPYGWGFVIGVPESEVKGALSKAVARFVVAALLLTALAMFLALWMARSIVGPVERIKAAADALGRGERVHAQPTGLVETDEVLQAMDRASLAIQGAAQTLERQVQEALARAERAHAVVAHSQRMEAIAHLTGGIAHDVNNLLMVVGTNAHLLQRKLAGQGADRFIATIQRAVDNGSRLTRQLLTFSRRQALAPEVVNLADRLPETLSLVKPAVGSGIDVELDVQDRPLCVEVDLGELELALLNLAVNAKDAMTDGGRLTIRARRDIADPAGPMVLVEVQDTGSGIPPEHLARVFEPFYTTKPPGQGTGLGLSQVFGLCQQAGGRVTIDSAVGRGTTVRLHLPEKAHASVAPPPPGPDAAQRLHARVLLVEDNDDVREATQRILEEAGAEVVAAGQADRAWELLQADGRFELVLSDIRMPGSMSGIDLAERVQRHHPNLPVLLFSGYTDRLDRAQALRLPVLQKPVQPAALLAALRQCLARAPFPGASEG